MNNRDPIAVGSGAGLTVSEDRKGRTCALDADGGYLGHLTIDIEVMILCCLCVCVCERERERE